MASQTKRPRRRQRLGLPKKRTARKQQQADLAVLTDEEFAASKTFKSARGKQKSVLHRRLCFNQQMHIVLDAEGDEHEFSTEDKYGFLPSPVPTWLTSCPRTSVLVVPSGKDPNVAHLRPDTENWVARIRKIVRRDNGEVSSL